MIEFVISFVAGALAAFIYFILRPKQAAEVEATVAADVTSTVAKAETTVAAEAAQATKAP